MVTSTPSSVPIAAEPLLIFPCNGNALEVLTCLGDGHRLIGFVDDTPAKQGTAVAGNPVYSRAAFVEFPSSRVLAVPGSPTSYRGRRSVIDGLAIEPERFTRVIHPRATISPLAAIGYNFLAMAGVVVTSNATIGNHVCVLPNTVIHHDSKVGEWTLLGAGVHIAGGVEIGENCYVGSGTSIKDGIKIGSGALIGIGSTVIRDVPPGAVVAGNPARVLR